ncbi:hypothetical protein [Streptomyces sp. ITFR-16]|uniref:hypothetical protein n=1 Tax=Streptomyces sp. ITFR-16 TaxID=3075198 RepID=UPI00288C4620|nr:hypothetical protein [Streptomyces sp. ITFR-16]WNI26886.1 hypothetical protein RLT58_12125 [Streptomyces sp. ITFR-16]
MRITAAFAVLAALGGYLTVQYVSGSRGSTGCTVQSADGSSGRGRTYRLTPEQASNAATISAVGTTRGMPERAVTIALATALQESGLRNIEHGDRDSLGLFQQRPSQGWGTEKEILDPVYSAGKFYQRLAEVPGYSRLPLTEAAQRVQRSGFPQAYAKHEPDAALLAAALTGRTPGALDCVPPRTTAGTGDASKVRDALVRVFGKGVLPDAADRAREAPAAGATAPDALAVPVRPVRRSAEGGAPQHGWELAHWAVAQSEALGVEEVAYAGRVWRAGSGWRDQSGGGGESRKSDTGEVRMRLVR